MIKVIDGIVTHNDITYTTGKTIAGLSEQDEARLVSLKVAEKIEITFQEVNNNPENSKGQGEKQKDEGQGGKVPNDKEQDENLAINFNPDDVIKGGKAK